MNSNRQLKYVLWPERILPSCPGPRSGTRPRGSARASPYCPGMMTKKTLRGHDRADDRADLDVGRAPAETWNSPQSREPAAPRITRPNSVGTRRQGCGHSRSYTIHPATRLPALIAIASGGVRSSTLCRSRTSTRPGPVHYRQHRQAGDQRRVRLPLEPCRFSVKRLPRGPVRNFWFGRSRAVHGPHSPKIRAARRRGFRGREAVVEPDE